MFFKSFIFENIIKSFNILDAKEKKYCKYIFIAMIFATVIEMIGIGSIPIFIITILSPELIYEKIICETIGTSAFNQNARFSTKFQL